MIKFQRFILENGLKVIIHEDDSTPMVAVNILYNVGARDESPNKTGFAHLFEHLMFAGSKHVDDFDSHIQMAGGDSNAFTNNDVTNFYNIVPAENVETVLWLEADRMEALNINSKALEVQRKVVLEEFNETCLNIPYGDAWHKIANIAFDHHPYRWPTIGLVPQHIEEAKLSDVKDFYSKYYHPNNAILVVAGDVKTDDILEKIKKQFSSIRKKPSFDRKLPIEPKQSQYKKEIITTDVPLNAIYLVFHIEKRNHPDFHVMDIISDILGSGDSSRLYRTVKKKHHYFADIDSYITGSLDPGLLVIEGKLAEEISLEKAEESIWNELEKIKSGDVSEIELQKYKNKAMSGLVFNECNVLNRAMNLAFFECVGDANLVNNEIEAYNKINLEDITKIANQILIPENCSVIIYKKEESAIA